MAIVHGNYYGTLKSEIELKLKSGKNVIWIMDVQGVKFILENYKFFSFSSKKRKID